MQEYLEDQVEKAAAEFEKRHGKAFRPATNTAELVNRHLRRQCEALTRTTPRMRPKKKVRA